MSAQDLLFSQSPLPSGDLLFGDDSTGTPATKTVTLAVTLPALAFVAQVGIVEEAYAVISLPQALVVEADVTYDNAVTPYLQNATIASHQAAEAPRPSADSGWSVSDHRRGGKDLRFDTATRAGHDADALHTQADFASKQVSAKQEIAARAGTDGSSAYQVGDKRNITRSSGYQVGSHSGTVRGSAMQTGINRRYVIRGDWQPARRAGHDGIGRSGHSAHRRGVQARVAPWQTTRNPPQGRTVAPPVIDPDRCYTPSADLLFSWLAIYSTPGLLFQCEESDALPSSTVIVPVRKVYMVSNNVVLRRVSDNSIILAKSMSLSLDVDSWAWSFNATLPGSALGQVEPTISGPVELRASVNGTDFIVLAEKVARERTFGRTDVRVSGRGRHAYLDKPYAPEKTFGNTFPRTAQQLMGDVLTFNNVPLGWSVSWELDDWLVPAKVFNHQGTYISALGAIVKAAGGFLLPHASLDQFTVKHRYPVAPWQWNTVTPNFVLPSDVTTRESLEWIEKPEYNRVYVSGQGQGVLGRVTRAGTAGDVLAPMVTDQLITTAAAARQNGLAVLGDTGRQIRIGLRLPVLPETGVIRPGAFVRYDDNGVPRMGLVRGTDLDLKLPDVWQSLDVETHLP